jgi:hypothetical protein
VERIYRESFGDAGPPCPFAFCLSGSGARKEACPYSDLDCFVVLYHGAGDADRDAMNVHSRFVWQRLAEMNYDPDRAARGRAQAAGFTFCRGGLHPLGPSNNGALTQDPVQLARLLESQIGMDQHSPERMEHIISGLQESSFGFGDRGLFHDFKTEVDQVMGHTCFRWNSRPLLTHRKRSGLEAIRDALRDFPVPNPADTRFDVKRGFYRFPQMVVKSLAWYYGIDAVSTEDQLARLVNVGRLHPNKRAVLHGVMQAPLLIRIAAHLESKQELDRVRTPDHPNDGNPDGEKVLTRAEVNDLRGVIGQLRVIRGWAEEFVRQKDKVIGRRVNPFAAP